MGLRISTNAPALAVQRNLTDAYDTTERIRRQIASGDRIVQPGDDEAGFATSESLRHQVQGLGVAQQNVQGATGIVQVAEGSLSEQSNILVRLRELAVQASSDTVSEKERGYLNTEFQQLINETDRVAQSTRYGSKKLLVGNNEEYSFQVGAGSDAATNAINFKSNGDTRASALGISGLSITDRGDARSALDTIDSAVETISDTRANFGALQSRLAHVSSGIESSRTAAAEARSKIADVDVAAASTQLATAQIRQQASTAVLAQANASNASALRLLS